MPHTGCGSKICIHLQTQSKFDFERIIKWKKTMAQEKLFSHKLFMSHDANCRWDLYPSLCHRTHGADIFPLIFSLKITCLFEPFAKELQLIN